LLRWRCVTARFRKKEELRGPEKLAPYCGAIESGAVAQTTLPNRAALLTLMATTQRSTSGGKHRTSRKQPAKQTSRCWPGYEPVPGTKRGQKGSCKPKAHQTAAEKKSDSMAAAASKRRKSK
jgi:hypothetical protein